jgi:hypothetical protein
MRRAVALFAAVLIAACSRSLSRSHAAKLIESNVKFAEPAVIKLPVGKLWFDYRNIFDAYPLHELEKQGLITVFETGQSHGMWNKEYVVRLTPAGEADQHNWSRTDEKVNSWFAPASPDAVIYSIPTAVRKLDEVTGIRSAAESGATEAAAEFGWHWEPTGFGRAFPKTPDAKAQKSEAAFQRYDDGWRVTRVALSPFD